MSDVKRQLKIKTGSVKRLAKEVVMYKKDEETETARVNRMKANGGDASDIKHAVSFSPSAGITLSQDLWIIHIYLCCNAGTSPGRSLHDGS